MPPKIIISGGGTGGHVFPAIAIADALKKLQPACELLFVGANDRLEMQKVPQAGYTIEGLWISGFQRKLSLQNLLFPVKLSASLLKSFVIIKRFKPQVVVGVGGYASGAVVYMANLMGIPTLIHEANSHAGVTNRLVANKVTKICTTYPNMQRFFNPQKTIFTGNPIRNTLTQIDATTDQARQFFNLNPYQKTIFVTGGSLGAKGINKAIENCLPQLLQNNIQVIWQAGKFFIEEYKKIAQPFENQIKIYDFIDNMQMAYTAADLVISRAGAGAISELCLIGKPTIFMPSPNVAEDHQTANAQALVQQNAAYMVKDTEAHNTLFETINKILQNQELQQDMVKNMKKFAKPDAAYHIAEEILTLLPTV